jgi:sugar/nucleoside kinase (ribokinase family)
VRVVTLGDLLLDVVVRVEDGLVAGADHAAKTRAGAGGQAANVAAWASACGGDARLVAKRGRDVAGELVARELAGHGVDLVGPPGARTGVVVSLSASGDRTMLSDRGSAPGLAPDELEPAWFECDALHLSGYSLMREPIASAALRGAELARAAGARVSVDPAAWTLIDEAFRARVRRLAPDVVLASERERDAVGPLDAEWVVKRGAEGVLVGGRAFRALPAEVVDATGAGDAFAGGFLVGGVEAGLEAARRCCERLGTMPG